MGNSALLVGMDLAQFESMTGLKSQLFAFNGVASAYYYLLIKNSISTANPVPKYLLLFFLDNLLTTPDLWIDSRNFIERIDEIAGANETTLLQKAYISPKGSIEVYLNGNIPIFGERQTIKTKIDNKLKYTLPRIVENCDKYCLDRSIETILNYGNVNACPITPIFFELDKWTGKTWNFNTLLEKSFLPDIIQITREKRIQLILVQEKNARVMNIEDETDDMRSYYQELYDYLEKEGVPLINMSHDPALTLDMFLDMMHVKPEAKSVFTQLVAKGFLSLLEK